MELGITLKRVERLMRLLISIFFNFYGIGK